MHCEINCLISYSLPLFSSLHFAFQTWLHYLINFLTFLTLCYLFAIAVVKTNTEIMGYLSSGYPFVYTDNNEDAKDEYIGRTVRNLCVVYCGTYFDCYIVIYTSSSEYIHECNAH